MNMLYVTIVGGLIIIKPFDKPLLQYAATSSFLSKLFGDYLDHQKLSGASCGTDVYSLQMLHDFAASQVDAYSLVLNCHIN